MDENQEKIQELCDQIASVLNGKGNCPFLCIAALELILTDVKEIQLRELQRGNSA